MHNSNLSSAPLRDVQFTKQLFSRLDSAGATNATVAVLKQTLKAVPAYELSRGERQTLLKMTEFMLQDGQLSCAEAVCLADMVHEYTSGCSPKMQYSLRELLSMPPCYKSDNGTLGNILQHITSTCHGGGPLGFPGLREQLADAVFKGAVDGALDFTEGNVFSDALQGAFDGADLSKLSAQERSELFGMVFTASMDGKINFAEAAAILNKLNQCLGPDCSIPYPIQQPGPVEKPWTVEQCGSTANIDLGDYTLTINETHSEFILTNKATGESSRIWGDPHFDIGNDGKTDMDFWGTMTLNLDNGTKITIQTTPWKGNENMTVSSRLVITQGNKAIEVTGMDQNKIGDMTITQSSDGYAQDIFTGDGLDIYESGDTWMVRDGLSLREVTQADMNATKNNGSDFDLVEGLQAMSLASITLFSVLTTLLFAQAFATDAGRSAPDVQLPINFRPA